MEQMTFFSRLEVKKKVILWLPDSEFFSLVQLFSLTVSLALCSVV